MSDPGSKPDDVVPIGEALRLIRVRVGSDQAEVTRRGGPDFWTIARWEEGEETPSLSQVAQYLATLQLNFYDFQDALDQLAQRPGHLLERLATIERRLSIVERRPDSGDG